MNLGHRIIRCLLALLFVTAVPAAAQEAPPAPFGLEWLKSADEIRALGVQLTALDGTDFGRSYAATNLPKALSDLDAVIISFGYNDQLYRIAALGKEHEDDDYGTSVRSRYEELAAALSKTYKVEKIHEQRSTDSFFGEPENFAYAISKRKAYWFRTFSSADADIELSIGSNHTDTYWRLIYSHREAEAAFESGKTERETDAL